MNSKITRCQDGEVIKAGPSVNRIAVAGADTAGRASVIEMSLDANWDGPPPHFHDRVDHTFVVIDGTVHLVVGGQRHLLHAGDVAWVSRGDVHNFSTTDHPVTLLEIDTGQPMDGYFRDLAAAFSPGTRPDPRVAGEIMARHDTHRVT